MESSGQPKVTSASSVHGSRPRRFRRLRGATALKTFVQCLGLSALLLVVNYGDLLGGGEDVRMHVPSSLAGICVAQMADILLLGLLLFLVLAGLKRTRYYPVARLLLVILAPPCILQQMRALIPFDIPDGVVLLGTVLWGALLVLLLVRLNGLYRRLMRFGNGVGVFLAILALCAFAQLAWVMLWKPGPQQHTVSWAHTPQPPRQHPLLVWIVFDELSYDQVFEHRAHDLQLPNFDALRAKSTVFPDARPIGYKTVTIIPSLLSGQAVDNYRFSFHNAFQIHSAGVHGWHPLDGPLSVFGDAQQAGWRTSAVGWYNPYCTIYGGSIDDCYFMNLDRIDGDMAQTASLWQNVYSPFQQIGRALMRPAIAARDDCSYEVRHRLETELDLQQHALQVLRTDQADFVFIHLAVPHSPNIWSRMDDGYTQVCDSSYLDNLALADHVLGTFLRTLQASPRWSRTSLIVQGDHSWRVGIWDSLPAWTDEDDAASRSGFDPRPAVLIHRAGQTQPATDPAAWSLLNVHSVVEQILHGQP